MLVKARWRGRWGARRDGESRTSTTASRHANAARSPQSSRNTALGELLPERHVVVATGGGTFAETDNRALMLADGAVVWLDLPLPRVIERVPADGRRPLAADRAQLEQLYTRRQLAYAYAHLRVDATRPVPEVVERLLAWIEY